MHKGGSVSRLQHLAVHPQTHPKGGNGKHQAKPPLANGRNRIGEKGWRLQVVVFVPICQVGFVGVTLACQQFLEKCVWPDHGHGLSGIDVNDLEI